MTIERELSQVEIIALDFYDGATEGFASSLGKLGAAYFKLIAWDDDQDQRLFVAVPTDKTIFEKMLELLSSNDSKPASKVWLANWVFRNEEEKSEATKMIETCQSNLKSKGVLILGDQVGSTKVRTFEINNSLIGSVVKALKEPENLEGWLVKLKGE